MQATVDLRNRALDLAGVLLDLASKEALGNRRGRALSILDSGAAWSKFLAICEAQGGFSEPAVASYTQPVLASRAGRVSDIDNRRLAKIAKLAGAPASVTAGLVCKVRIGDEVQAREPLFHVHAESPGELEYALSYADKHPDVIAIGDAE